VAIIEFDNVCKAYRLGTGRGSLREAIPELFGRLVGRTASDNGNLLWALKGVSFQVERGESLALLGPNGAGKTTVLKLLSRITRPTSGRVHLGGRLSALIELGAGFHPDLTGRENVYLNGTILGLKRAEIARRFDDIVDFAGLHQFIDTPVKRYSSGMYVRLGFAVAIHVDPEVLLVDEVLSVGDFEFQRKCQRAMREKLGETTVILVSHNLAAVNAVCQRALWLDHGEVRREGPTNEVIEAYVSSSGEATPLSANTALGRRWGTGEARITSVRVLNRHGQEEERIQAGEGLQIEIQYDATERIEDPVFGFAIYDSSGMNIYGENTSFGPFRVPWIEGRGTICCHIDSLPLPEGEYLMSVALEPAVGGSPQAYDYHEKAYTVRVRQAARVFRVGMLALDTRWAHDRR